MTLLVEALNIGQSAALLSDGQIVPVTNWLDDGDDCDPQDATFCVCGPCKNGLWYLVDLSEMKEVMQ
jgi:hypothetical protein